MKIHLSSDLHRRITSLGDDPCRLVDEFAQWKGDPQGRQTILFGRDVANTGSRYVRHAHMIPINNAGNLASWKKIYAKSSHSRTHLHFSRTHYRGPSGTER